jgi:hypothetical protein
MLTTKDANADSVPSDEFASNCSEAIKSSKDPKDSEGIALRYEDVGGAAIGLPVSAASSCGGIQAWG